jgi:hypothetical protein
MHRSLAGFGSKHISFNPDEISYIEELFKHNIIKCFIFSGAKIIAFYIELDFTATVLNHRKTGFSHIPHTHHPTGKAYIGIMIFG